jgi:hypothetical protein
MLIRLYIFKWFKILEKIQFFYFLRLEIASMRLMSWNTVFFIEFIFDLQALGY